MSLRDRILDAIDWTDLREQALDIVLRLEDADAPGREKMDQAIEQLAEWVDDTLDWHRVSNKPLKSVLEWADGRVIRWVLRGALELALQEARFVQGTYDGE